jgi:hypothetical protein
MIRYLSQRSVREKPQNEKGWCRAIFQYAEDVFKRMAEMLKKKGLDYAVVINGALWHHCRYSH